jgi:hypothetical protein
MLRRIAQIAFAIVFAGMVTASPAAAAGNPHDQGPLPQDHVYCC